MALHAWLRERMPVMTTTMTYTGTLVVEDCCVCYMRFGMPVDLQQQRLRDHRSFYCPAGHAQSYTGKTEEQRLRERLAVVEGSERFYRNQLAMSRRQTAAAKGQRTRVLNLIAKGICPVPGCRRNFGNVREHMATVHPDWHKHEEPLS